MVVPFGFGVGDFVSLGTLAWNLYNSCKEAPESFGKFSSEVLFLHFVLKEFEEVLARPLAPKLEAAGERCHLVLKDLDKLVRKYQSLGTQQKRIWDRVRYGMEAQDIADLRARLTSNVTVLLTALIRWVLPSS